MKQFACGSVVAGCRAVFRGADENEILTQVAQHARGDHGLTEISGELIAAVRENITPVAG